jgi:DNA polymerase
MRDELAALVADMRALLAHGTELGLDAELADAEAPAADPALEQALMAEEAAEPEPEVATAEPAWGALAAKAREPDGEGAAGLAKIRDDLGDCTRCRLCEGRRNIVYGVGDPEADLMVIGEGPGEQEDRSGEPFVGPAGQMLDKMLVHVLGLQRSQVYIANVVKCRPPQNRNPRPDEVDACKPFLERQIDAIQPKVILVLGSVALQHALGIRGIMRNRGQEKRYHATYGEVLAIPTFHPAYLLRKPEDKRLTFDDLKLVRRRYDELGGRR